MWNFGALKAIENRSNIDELSDLLPPIFPANKPAKEGRIYLSAIGTEKDEILSQREFQSRRNERSLARIAPPRQDNIVWLRRCLASPLDKMFMANASCVRHIYAAVLDLWNGDVRIAT
jgi:hypothetical protein